MTRLCDCGSVVEDNKPCPDCGDGLTPAQVEAHRWIQRENIRRNLTQAREVYLEGNIARQAEYIAWKASQR